MLKSAFNKQVFDKILKLNPNVVKNLSKSLSSTSAPVVTVDTGNIDRTFTQSNQAIQSKKIKKEFGIG